MDGISGISESYSSAMWPLAYQAQESAASTGARPEGKVTQSGEKSQDRTGVIVDISPQGRAMAKAAQDKKKGEGSKEAFNTDQQVEVQELKARDRAVRAHEQAHLAAAGNLARSGPKYVYTTGPDGNRYVVNGEVDIDTTPVRDDPPATLRKAQRIRSAALAPPDPSAQDRRVAAVADQMASAAQQEIAQKNNIKNKRRAARSVNVRV